MFGRLILQYWSVGGRLRDAGNVYRLCIHSCSPKIGNVRNQIQLNGYRIFHSSISRNENCTSKFSSLQRLSIGLLSATGVQLLVFKTTYCRATLNPDVRLKSCIKEADIKFDWRKFWSMIRPYIWHLLAAVGSALVVAVVNIRIPSMLGHIINVVTNLIGSKMDHSTLRQQMIEPAIQLMSLYGAQALFTFLYIYLLSCVGERVAASMKLELFSSILRQDLVFFDTHRTGDILSRLTVDVQDFKSSLKLCISQGIRSIAQILGCSVSLFFISPEMAGGMLVVVPAVIWVGTVLGSLLRSISTAAQTQAGKATLVSDQAIGSIRTVRAFAMEEAEYEMFAREVMESCHLNERLGFGIGLFQAGTNIFLNGLILGTLYVGGRLMAANQLSAGDLMAFLVATQTIQRSLAQLSLLYGHVMKGMAAGGRIFSLINLEPQMPITGGKKIPYHSMLGDVKFNDVTFAYPTRPQQKILENFFLHLAPGTTVAVVGSSGNGKSTIAALLERFYDVDDGSITIDDIDIRELDPTWLRGTAIGFINQEPILFAGSIMDNIRYGKRDATDEEVIEVAKLANADDFIRKFPDGYDTVVGERGVTISGGQKQRIAIARALIKNPSILLLDEATSALDAESEKIVQDALDRLTRGRTVLVIAHRLSTVRNADLIVVLSNGEIVEMGTHEDLTQKKGFYWSLFWQQQLHEPPRSSA